MRATRADVARAAGVSVATVSYIMSGKKRFSVEVEERVRAIAKQMHYIPNHVARSLVSKCTKTIAFLTNDIGNYYQLEVIKGFQKAALEKGYVVYLFEASEGIDEYIEHIISRGVDGIFVIVAPDACPDDRLEALLAADICVVADYARNSFVKGASYIMSDMQDGFMQIVRHLTDLGHRNIGYISAFDETCVYDFRIDAYRKAMKTLTGQENPFILYGDWPFRSDSTCGDEMTTRALTQNPDLTALICTNDLMAFGAMNAAERLGKRVPRDLSVVGIDNIAQSASARPPLTTLSQDGRAYGRRIFDILYSGITDGVVGKYVVPMQLVVRASTGAPNKRQSENNG